MSEFFLVTLVKKQNLRNFRNFRENFFKSRFFFTRFLVITKTRNIFLLFFKKKKKSKYFLVTPQKININKINNCCYKFLFLFYTNIFSLSAIIPNMIRQIFIRLSIYSNFKILTICPSSNVTFSPFFIFLYIGPGVIPSFLRPSTSKRPGKGFWCITNPNVATRWLIQLALKLTNSESNKLQVPSLSICICLPKVSLGCRIVSSFSTNFHCLISSGICSSMGTSSWTV